MSLAVKPFIQELSAALSHMLPSQTEHTNTPAGPWQQFKVMKQKKSLFMVSITSLIRPQMALRGLCRIQWASHFQSILLHNASLSLLYTVVTSGHKNPKMFEFRRNVQKPLRILSVRQLAAHLAWNARCVYAGQTHEDNDISQVRWKAASGKNRRWAQTQNCNISCKSEKKKWIQQKSLVWATGRCFSSK